MSIVKNLPYLCRQSTNNPDTANCERLKGIVFIILYSGVAITYRLRIIVRLNRRKGS